ncbi:hypothetical protein [Pararhizobium arenae]|uniref:hypothetical protein n=1 Tax=Pararhizobium arenae TaxID=1856850 RepID=UPI00094AE7A3|nr:hypothetical protein [Pararhizobium arenae]
MSELQNRIIERLATPDGLQRASGSDDKREMLVTAALHLFFAFGGNADELRKVVSSANKKKSTSVADAVAEVVVATAAISSAADLDMVQAAFNWIDSAPKPQ